MFKLVGPGRSWKTALGSIALAIAVVMPISIPGFAADEDAVAMAPEDIKERFQSDYRRLLDDAARLERNAVTSRENYSQAQQRNYPRGAARQKFLLDEADAKRDLVKVEEEIERFKMNGRIEGALPGWFYEVEEEPRRGVEPAAPAEVDQQDREGRNPLYRDSE